MNNPTLLISLIAIFAIIVIVAFLVFRQRGKVEIKGPLGTQLNLNASNDPPPLSPGVKADGVVSQSGNIEILDETGRGVDTRDIRAKKMCKFLVSSQKEIRPQKNNPRRSGGKRDGSKCASRARYYYKY